MKYKFYVYNGNNSSLIKKCLLEREIWEELQVDDESQIEKYANTIWRSINFSVRKHAIIEEYHRKSNIKQFINHFENTRGMTTKTGIIRSLKQYYQTNELSRQAQYTCFDSTATTFIITAGQDNIEMASFIQRFNQIQRKCFNKEAVPLKHCQDNMWLLKPANFNQGRGIEIFKNLKEIQQFLNTRKPNSLWVAQKYIEKPFLFKQRKFDIRVWVLVTQQGEVFFHKFPYVRTSSAKYDTGAQDNYVHLTNNCLQQKGNSYGQHEDGNTLPVEELFEYIKQKYPNQQIDIQQFLMQKMKDLVIDTFNAIKDQMLNSKRNYCYELFGYDFLIDEDLRVWLIETNLNPYLGVPNNYIGDILPKMVNSMFQIILDPHFPPSQNYKNVENQFDLIYCDNNSIYNNNKPINTRSPFNSSLYPIDELKQIPNYKQYQDIKKQQQQQIKIQIQTPVIKENSKRKSKKTLQYDSKCQNNIFSKKSLNKTGDIKLKEQGYKFSLPSINQNNSNLNVQNDKKNQNDESDTYRRQNSRVAGQNIHKVNLSTSNLNKSYYEESSEEESSKLTLSQKHKQIFSESKIIKQHKSRNKNEIPLTLEQINEKQGLQMKEIYHKVKNLIKNYPYQDYEPLQNYVQNCLTKLINWELYDENEIEWTIKTIQIVMNSRFIGVFSEQKNIDTLIQIIDSQNFLLKIQLIAIQLIKYICKNVSLKLFVLGKDITKSLMKIALSSVDPREREKYDQQLRLEAIRSIITLGGIYDRKAFIPGETRKNDDARRSLIENGGVLALIQIKHQTDEDLIIEQMKKFFLNLDLKDYEQQLDLIVQWIEKFKSQKNDKENQNMVVNMLDAGNQEIDIEDNVQDMYKIELNSAKLMVENIISKRKKWIKQWEEKQKLKNDMELIEQRKLDEHKNRIYEEKQKKLEEYQKKKQKELQLKNEMERQKEQKRLLDSQKEIESKLLKMEGILRKKEEQIKMKKQTNEQKGFLQEKNIIEEQLMQMKQKQQQINNEIMKQKIDFDQRQADRKENVDSIQNSDSSNFLQRNNYENQNNEQNTNSLNQKDNKLYQLQNLKQQNNYYQPNNEEYYRQDSRQTQQTRNQIPQTRSYIIKKKQTQFVQQQKSDNN